MINEEPSVLQEHSLFSADTCKASQGSIAGRCLFTSTQSHNDSTHFEIRPLHTHTHTCARARAHTMKTFSIFTIGGKNNVKWGRIL